MSLKLSRNPKGVAHNRLAAHPRGVAILLITEESRISSAL